MDETEPITPEKIADIRERWRKACDIPEMVSEDLANHPVPVLGAGLAGGER